MARTFRLALLAAAAFVLTLATTPAGAQQSTVKRAPIKPINDVSGAASFKEYCTVCHGVSGKGDGPAAKALTKAPADLTLIAQRNGGRFNASSVQMAILGDTGVTAHGTPDMPIWGHVFHTVEGDSVAMLRVRNLVEYLEALQAK